jgi:hypothetical protein
VVASTFEKPMTGANRSALTDAAKPPKKAERQERLQVALRENLRRRKAQARGRAGLDQGDAPEAQPPDPAKTDAQKG